MIIKYFTLVYMLELFNNYKSKWKIILLIYIGSLCYVFASYYHLKFKHWSFFSALSLAIPMILIEYTFSLHGNRFASDILKFSPLDILLLTIIFYFINIWLLNVIVLKKNINIIKEIIAFAFILIAFKITTAII